jgi:hypothetical protein
MTVRLNQGHVLSWLLLGSWLLAGGAMAAVIWFEVVNWTFSTVTQQEASAGAFEANSHPQADKLNAKGYRTPYLAFQNTTGAINDPLPLGIVLNNGAGGETLVLSDLAEGTKLSAGTELGRTRWSVPGRDLDKAFIAAPENFSGSMQVTAKLYSSGNLVLETKNIRFEWAGWPTENRLATVGLAAKDALGSPDLAVEGTDAIGSSNHTGKDASTTSGYSDSSLSGRGVLGLSDADWASQITFGQQPLAQVSGSNLSAPKK